MCKQTLTHLLKLVKIIFSVPLKNIIKTLFLGFLTWKNILSYQMFNKKLKVWSKTKSLLSNSNTPKVQISYNSCQQELL
jgi:hypothetical protein